MADQMTFEFKLQSAFDRFADEASVQVDALTLATVVTDRASRRFVVPMVRLQRPSWLMPAMLIGLLVIVLISAMFVGSVLLKQPRIYQGVFMPEPSMSVGRDQPIVLTLADGRVLLAGGNQYTLNDDLTPEIFDPQSGRYIAIAGDVPIGSGRAVQLRDGRVLVALLRDLDNQTRFLIIDPVALTAHQLLNDAKTRELWSGSVTVGMTPLPDGEVLITGGTDFDGRAFLFDPMNDQMAQIHSMSTPRTGHAAVALSDGRVLVAAGRSSYSPASVYYGSDGQLSSAEIYDPATASFTAAGELPSVRGQAWGSRLPDGRVLLIAIGDRLQFGLPQAETVALDVFDPATNTFSALRPQDWPGPPTFTALPDGRVLVTGIAPDRSSAKLSKVPWAAIYDPIAQTTTEVQAPPQVFPQGAALSDGRVIVVGGFRDDPTAGAHVPVPWIEIFQ